MYIGGSIFVSLSRVTFGSVLHIQKISNKYSRDKEGAYLCICLE